MMNDGFQFFDIILFAMIAGFILLRLRGVLGRRTGNERRRPNFLSRRRTEDGTDKVIPLPDPDAEVVPAGDDFSDVDDSALAAGLTQIKLADPRPKSTSAYPPKADETEGSRRSP